MYYNVKPSEAGIYDMNIIIKFIPKEGNVIILPTELKVIVSGENSGDDSNNNVSDDNTDDNSDDANNNTNNVNINFGGNDNSNTNDNDTNKKLSPYAPLIITGGILLVILIILIVIGGKPKQGQENKPNESKNKNNFYEENKSVKSDKINTKKRLNNISWTQKYLLHR